MPRTFETNDTILAWVESVGGGYVWEPEIFAVSLLGTNLQGEGYYKLFGLKGVDQLAIEARTLQFYALERLSRIPGLKSLVINGSSLQQNDLKTLNANGVKTELIDNRGSFRLQASRAQTGGLLNESS